MSAEQFVATVRELVEDGYSYGAAWHAVAAMFQIIEPTTAEVAA